MKILIIVNSVSMYENSKLETGLWLSELTHMYHLAKEQGYDITIEAHRVETSRLTPKA